MIYTMLLAAAAPYKDQTADLPNFVFKNVVAGEAWYPGSVGTCHGDSIPGNPIYPAFRPETDNSTTCGPDGYDKVAGVDASISYIFARRKDGRFGLSSIVIISKEMNFSAVLSAFVAKYGEPSSTRVGSWESRGGAKLDNHIAVWKFRTGILTIYEHGYDITHMLAIYDDQLQPPPKAAKVDF